ncbi:MAG TPA: 2-deoxyribose-5-phosphate aldolase, partial [Nitrospira sp.]
MSGWNLPALIDHTVLRPDATKAEVLRLCEEAKANGFTVIFVPPCYLDEAVAAVAGTGIRVGIPIGFPLGGHSTKTKVAEALEAVQRGATVLDMVLNISRLKSADHDYVRMDIAEVVTSTVGVEHKVIL